MTVNEAIKEAARYFKARGNYSPSHCDVRCFVNDATADNPNIVNKGYDQNHAHKRVCRLIEESCALD